jgi:hypothetical membrane protein
LQTTSIQARRQQVPWWALASAGIAPLVLVGGWTIAASRQHAGYDAVRDTISSLAARGATDRWVMTTALFALGTCYVVTGLGLRIAPPAARLLLVGGGVATMMVATFPQPERGNAIAHSIAAAIAFIALAAWPACAIRPGADMPLMSPAAAISAVAVICGLLLWFTLELHGSQRGLAERAAAFSEALWPLVVLAAARYALRPRRPANQGATYSAGAA